MRDVSGHGEYVSAYPLLLTVKRLNELYYNRLWFKYPHHLLVSLPLNLHSNNKKMPFADPRQPSKVRCKMPKVTTTGADPGFPIGGGTNPPGGTPTYDFAKFCKKLHELEKNFMP